MALFGFIGALRLQDNDRWKASLALFLGVFCVTLNTNFIAWPFIAVLAVGYLWTIRRNRYVLIIAVTFMALLIGVAVVLNKPSLHWLLMTPPASSPTFVLKWNTAWGLLRGSLRWASVPFAIYFLVAVGGLFHPDPNRRMAAIASFATAIPVQYICLVGMIGRSDYPVSPRYLLPFLAPILSAFLLGIDSALARIQKIEPRGLVPLNALCALAFVALVPWKAMSKDAQLSWQLVRSSAPNYSSEANFFARVSSLNRPTVVLTNWCWLSCVPKLYLEAITPIAAPLTVLNVSEGCETSTDTLRSSVSRFLKQRTPVALVVIFFQADGDGPTPCSERAPAVLSGPAGRCVGAFEMKDVAEWLTTTYLSEISDRNGA